jgi:hypothetical protein
MRKEVRVSIGKIILASGVVLVGFGFGLPRMLISSAASLSREAAAQSVYKQARREVALLNAFKQGCVEEVLLAPAPYQHRLEVKVAFLRGEEEEPVSSWIRDLYSVRIVTQVNQCLARRWNGQGHLLINPRVEFNQGGLLDLKYD